MSIHDVTEEQIFHTLGRGRATDFKPKDKPKPVEKPVPVKIIPSPEVDDFEKKLIDELNELNNRVNEIQKTIKWYIIPLFFVILALSLAMLAGFVLRV
ncbi:MAG: hypothetical protein PHU34_11450 [Candidatus Methanoperedens sp.]|nr:hypothetical protein [Candidatus Methanoperedens sp.]